MNDAEREMLKDAAVDIVAAPRPPVASGPIDEPHAPLSGECEECHDTAHKLSCSRNPGRPARIGATAPMVAGDPEHARLVAAAETHDALLRVAREERDEAEAECARLREALDAVRRERDALRAEVADLLPLADAQAFAGGVAQREIETLRANLSNANAELCALRARVDAQSGVIAASATLRVEYNEAVAQHCAAATEATTLRAQIAAANERAAQAWEAGRNAADDAVCDAVTEDDHVRTVDRLVASIRALTPPEAPDATN